MRTNVVLVDFENVQPASLESLVQGAYRVLVFVGAQQAKLSFDFVAAMQRLGDKVEYVKMSGIGPNALDFHIAYYIGRISAQDPTASFHIVSNDSGFDPLVTHLISQGIPARRVGATAQLGKAKADPKKAAKELAKPLAKMLRQPKSTRPRTDKTLARFIATHFSALKLTDGEVAAVIKALQADGLLRLEGGKVSYSIA
ncbi:MAG TPA: PIN domain-containing protein [Coriobacteriia bacterium]|nr:PIN domain-containing protein [Coriobacteriia bacterium]